MEEEMDETKYLAKVMEYARTQSSSQSKLTWLYDNPFRGIAA